MRILGHFSDFRKIGPKTAIFWGFRANARLPMVRSGQKKYYFFHKFMEYIYRRNFENSIFKSDFRPDWHRQCRLSLRLNNDQYKENMVNFLISYKHKWRTEMNIREIKMIFVNRGFRPWGFFPYGWCAELYNTRGPPLNLLNQPDMFINRKYFEK